MRIRPALALPAAAAFASLLTGLVAAPPTHLAQSRADAEGVAGPVDGGGPVDLSMPWDQPVAPANSTPLGPPMGLPVTTVGSDGQVPGQSTGVTVTPALIVTGSTSGIPSPSVSFDSRTVTRSRPNAPSFIAEMSTEPLARPVTSPVELMVATAGLLIV